MSPGKFELTIDEISSPEFDSQYFPSLVEVPIWLNRHRLLCAVAPAQRDIAHSLLSVEIGFANMHFVDLYPPMPGDEGFVVQQTDVLRPVVPNAFPQLPESFIW